MAYCREHWAPHGGRWCPSNLPREAALVVENQGPVPPAVSVTDNRVMDESFVWAGMHIGGGMTAWLDVSLRSAAPLETTLYVLVELEKVEVSSSKTFKIYMRARIYQPR